MEADQMSPSHYTTGFPSFSISFFPREKRNEEKRKEKKRKEKLARLPLM
jgi:hypothetical protein